MGWRPERERGMGGEGWECEGCEGWGQRLVDVCGGEETGSVGWWGRLGTAGRRRGWDGWPGQRPMGVRGARRKGVSGAWVGGGRVVVFFTLKAYAISPRGITIFP